MVRQGKQNTDKYPRCGKIDEHTEHVILCQGDGTEKRFKQHLKKLKHG